jgi:meso-butanediol dehydrogenase/(S,S)-butanediol dehydrogenase/diacetyl reductase
MNSATSTATPTDTPVAARFTGRVALVTGGGRGIGRAISQRLNDEGAAVAVVDINADAAVAAATALGLSTAIGIEADVTRPEAIEAALEVARSELGPIDVLVNNVAVATHGDLATTKPESWAADLEGSLGATYLVSRAVLPGMLARGRGVIVNIGSVNGLLALGNPAYSAAKAGLISLTQSLAVEYGPKGIRANLVSPGTVRTETPSWQARLKHDPDIFERLTRWYPVGRVGRPEDIAAAVAYLASDEASFVNGANLVVDGGLTAGIGPMIDELILENR